MARILIVDDEPSILSVLATLLRKHGHDIAPANGGEAALDLLKNGAFDLMLTDIKMEPINGLELLDSARKMSPNMAVVLVTGYGSIKTAVDAMKGGAFDYITKPFKIDELLLTVQRALQYRSALVENATLRAKLDARSYVDNIVAESVSMRKLCEMVQRVAPTDATVLIVGESGTGKEVVARAIHHNSHRKDHPFVPVNCAAMPEPLLESEMFGHMKGAFTGASAEKTGLFESAQGGTLFLDEIGAMPLSLQAKFLRVLQDKHIRKVGSNQTYPVDVRVIAATNEPLERKMARQEFREDLFYRISVIPIEIAPLRDRREDIMPLVSYFIDQSKKGEQKVSIDLDAQRILESYNWPGNVRELENAIRHAVTFTRDGTIRRDDLPVKVVEAVSRLGPSPLAGAEIEEYRGKSLRSFLRSREREYIQAVIDKMKGNKEEAAKALNISLATLYRKLSDDESAE